MALFVQLTMLDTRIIARDKQLAYADYMTTTGLDIAKFQADLTNPVRTLMGYTQRDWLVDKLKAIYSNMECSRAASFDE